jgi:hypothetical protein
MAQIHIPKNKYELSFGLKKDIPYFFLLPSRLFYIKGPKWIVKLSYIEKLGLFFAK